MSKIKVAFICVHNSCRSQIAEAFGRHLASDVFQSYSAGTETKPQINQDAVRIMKELYNIDMEADGQFSKLVSDIPNPDIAISMGCNVGCPFIGRPFDDNWGLEDPTGKSDEKFKIVIEKIRKDILKLKMDWIRGRQHQIPVCRADNLSFYQCKKSNYQREGFIIQCEGLDEDTGEKEYTMLWKQK